LSTDHPLLRGALLVIAAEFLFTSMGAVVRVVSLELNVVLILFFRSIFGILLMTPLLVRLGREGMATRVYHRHLLRALSGVSALCCFFYAIAHIPLTNAILFKMTSPLFIPLVALFWLGESVTWRVNGAILLGLLGVALILTPEFGTLGWIGLLALLSGFLTAVARTAVRKLTITEPTERIVLYFALNSALLTSLLLPLFWQPVSVENLLWLVLLAILGWSGQFLLTRGFALADAGRLGVFAYFSVLFGALYGWWFWDEVLTWITISGGLLVILAGTLVGDRRNTP
jgi:drug/metabolite transporter (DMT)-like permease